MKQPGGRPPVYDWDAIKAQFSVVLHTEGIAPTDTEMAKRLDARLETIGMRKRPSFERLKARVGLWMRALRSES